MFLYYMAPFHSFPVCSVFLHIARSGKGFTWNCCFSLYRIDSTSCLLTLWLTRKVSALSLSIIHYKWNRSKLVAIFEILTSQTRIFYSSVHCCFFFFPWPSQHLRLCISLQILLYFTENRAQKKANKQNRITLCDEELRKNYHILGEFRHWTRRNWRIFKKKV